MIHRGAGIRRTPVEKNYKQVALEKITPGVIYSRGVAYYVPVVYHVIHGTIPVYL